MLPFAIPLFGSRTSSPSVLAFTPFSGTSRTHTFNAATTFAAIVFTRYDDVAGSIPSTTCTVNGASASFRVLARYSATFQPSSRIFTINNPSSGLVQFQSIGTATSFVAGFIIEFSATPSVGTAVATPDENQLTVSSNTVLTPSITVGTNTVVVWGAVLGAGSNALVTAFSGVDFRAIPNTPSTTFYGSAAGYSFHTVSATISRTWTMNTSNTHYAYLTGLRLDF